MPSSDRGGRAARASAGRSPTRTTSSTGRYVELGQPQEAVFSPLALAIYEELDDLANQAVVQNAMGGFAYYQGRWDEAVELYERAARRSRRSAIPCGAPTRVFNIAEIRCDQLRLAEAPPVPRRGAAVWRAAGWRVRVALGTRLQGRGLARGRPAEALALFEEAREGFAEVGAQNEVIATDGRIIEALPPARRGRARPGLAADALEQARGMGAANVYVPLLQRGLGLALRHASATRRARGPRSRRACGRHGRAAAFEVALTLGALLADEPDRRPRRSAPRSSPDWGCAG